MAVAQLTPGPHPRSLPLPRRAKPASKLSRSMQDRPKESQRKNDMRYFRFLPLLCALLLQYAFAQQKPSTASATQADSAGVAPPGTAVQNEADPLLDLPPLPKGQVSLVGGKVVGVDRVRNKVTVEAFGGKKMKFGFDERTHIYRDGRETTEVGIRKGDRVYVDAQLVGSTAFARNIRVMEKSGPADAQGQIVRYDASRGAIVLRDALSSEPATFRLSPDTVVRGKASSVSELREGALVSVTFTPDSGKEGIAREITVIARPGETFTFAGDVMHLDMRSGIIVVRNRSDGKSYEIQFDPASQGSSNLAVGSEVTVAAEFNGTGYRARNVTLAQSAGSTDSTNK